MPAEYRAIFSSEAREDFAKLPYQLRKVVRSEIERLCESPATISRPAPTPPFPPNRQVFEFNTIMDGFDHRFAVLFRYTQDEQGLFILGIGHW